MIQVLIAASSAVMRAGLEAVVRSSNALAFIRALSLEELENRMGEVTADVLLLESSDFDEEWINTLAEVAIPAVVLTESPDPAWLATGFRSSVRAVLSTDASGTEITAALQAAAAGLVTMQPTLLDLLATDPRPVPAKLEEPLSRREIEVLGMLAEGLSNKLIAHRMGISEHTVKFHVTSIMSKLHAGSRTDAVMQGIRRGLLLV